MSKCTLSTRFSNIVISSGPKLFLDLVITLPVYNDQSHCATALLENIFARLRRCHMYARCIGFSPNLVWSCNTKRNVRNLWSSSILLGTAQCAVFLRLVLSLVFDIAPI
ncbi:hypothetical protein L208DRAFT_721265 [Tricholoma matsutake]|nr:hypothetical protein L208DRAFT_721265 [Tricholoma matsutake 945]